MSKEKEDFKKECIANLELLHQSVKERIADTDNAALKEYLEGYDAGCLMALEVVKSKSTD